MPKFTIVETLIEEREVEADTAQEALDLWLNRGDGPGVSVPSIEVVDRDVVDEAGNICEVEHA